MSRHPINSLDGITAAQLLPVVSPIVAAGAGARIASILTNPQHALGTVICCYVLWGMAVPLAMMVMVMYYQRLCAQNPLKRSHRILLSSSWTIRLWWLHDHGTWEGRT